MPTVAVTKSALADDPSAFQTRTSLTRSSNDANPATSAPAKGPKVQTGRNPDAPQSGSDRVREWACEADNSVLGMNREFRLKAIPLQIERAS